MTICSASFTSPHSFDFDELAGLAVLVAREEVVQFVARVLRNIRDVLDVRPARVLVGHAHDLRVAARLVAHVENADGSHLDSDARVDRVFEQNECVDGVTVESESVLEMAVVDGVAEWCEEHAIGVDASRFVVNFVLVPASARNLNDNVVLGHGGSFSLDQRAQ